MGTGRTGIFERREVIVDGVTTVYRMFRPQTPAPPPVILFLHGAGESGIDGEAPTKVGIGPAIDAQPERFPAIVVFPQASQGYGWRGFNLAAAFAALDDVERAFETDRSHTCVTGISMGGYGAWLAALLQPARFSSAVPVCGGLDASAAIRLGLIPPVPPGELHDAAARRIAAIPQWVFHGDADNIIPVSESRLMVDALRRAGAAVRYTEYAGVRHNSWDRAYAEPELIDWMLGR